MRTIRIDVDLLKKEDIGLGVAQEIYDLRQLESAVDVPIHNSNRTARPGEPLIGRKILGDDFVRRHPQACAVASCGNTFCWAKLRSVGSSISAQASPSVLV